MTKAQAAQKLEADPDYFDRKHVRPGNLVLERRGKEWFSHLGKLSAAKKLKTNGKKAGSCSQCLGPCRRYDNRIECTKCGWKVYDL